MALDVYVMPLWRFKAGDFTSPIEAALGIKPTIISLSGEQTPSPPARPPWYLRWLAALGIIEITVEPDPPDPAVVRAAAVWEVNALKAEMSRLTGGPVDWHDEGGVHYSQQFHASGFLRAFAAWHDHRDALPEFLPAPPDKDRDYYPVWDQPEPVRRQFPTLAKHSLYTGYFLPVPFAGVYEVEPFKMMGHWDAHHDAASSQTVLAELDELLASVAGLLAAGGSPEHVKFVEAAKTWAGILREICALSVEHGLPVIFYG